MIREGKNIIAEQITHTIKQITGFSDQEIALVLEKFEKRTIKKKTVLLTAGTTAKEVYFILDGLMRLYYHKDGEDISAYFFNEGMFAGAYDSFVSQRPSRHYFLFANAGAVPGVSAYE